MTKVISAMKGHVGPNMTPMVDIVMCILIFFMLAAGWPHFVLSQTLVPVSGGSVNGEKRAPDVGVRVPLVIAVAGERTAVTAFGSRFELAKATGENAELSALLAERRRVMSDEVVVLIQPAKDVSYRDVISVYNACVKARFARVAFRQAT